VTDGEWGASVTVAVILLAAVAVVVWPPGGMPRGRTLAVLLLGLGVVLTTAWVAWVLWTS
jgi:hypothetical protein